MKVNQYIDKEITYEESRNKIVWVTRYPLLDYFGMFPTYMHILSTNEMDPSGKLHVSAFKGGSSQFYDNYGNPTNEFDSVKRDGGIRNNIIKGNLIQMSDKPFHDSYPSGPTDSDAVNFANEATKNAGGNN